MVEIFVTLKAASQGLWSARGIINISYAIQQDWSVSHKSVLLTVYQQEYGGAFGDELKQDFSLVVCKKYSFCMNRLCNQQCDSRFASRRRLRIDEHVSNRSSEHKSLKDQDPCVSTASIKGGISGKPEPISDGKYSIYTAWFLFISISKKLNKQNSIEIPKVNKGCGYVYHIGQYVFAGNTAGQILDWQSEKLKVDFRNKAGLQRSAWRWSMDLFLGEYKVCL